MSIAPPRYAPRFFLFFSLVKPLPRVTIKSSCAFLPHPCALSSNRFERNLSSTTMSLRMREKGSFCPRAGAAAAVLLLPRLFFFRTAGTSASGEVLPSVTDESEPFLAGEVSFFGAEEASESESESESEELELESESVSGSVVFAAASTSASFFAFWAAFFFSSSSSESLSLSLSLLESLELELSESESLCHIITC